MNVTMKEIVDAREALVFLSQQKLSIKLSYTISKLLRKINVELEALSKARQEVISRLAPEGTAITPEINQAIGADLDEVLSETVSIDLNKIDLSGISVEITPRDVMALEPFCLFETVTLD